MLRRRQQKKRAAIMLEAFDDADSFNKCILMILTYATTHQVKPLLDYYKRHITGPAILEKRGTIADPDFDYMEKFGLGLVDQERQHWVLAYWLARDEEDGVMIEELEKMMALRLAA